MKEQWKDIRGYEGLYEVSNTGLVRSVKREIILASHSDGNGTQMIDLYGGDQSQGVGIITKHNAKRRKLHRIVGEHWIPNPEGFRFLIHKNGNKEKNGVDNLYWSRWCGGDSNVGEKTKK